MSAIDNEILQRLKIEATAQALVNGFKREADVSELVKKHRFDIKRKPKEDDGVCWINGELVGSKGNILSLTGKAKSRKTVLASSIVASALSGREVLGVNCRLNEGETLLHIDTEQGYTDYYNSIVRIIRICGEEDAPENFISIHERAFDVAQRLDSLELLFKQHRPTICVIDGIRDMLMDFNSNEETSKVISAILRLSYDYDCLIICVIHVTKSHGNMRGALGTALEDKSETVILVEKDEKEPNRSTFKPLYSRHKDFQAYNIVWSDFDGGYIVENEPTQEQVEVGRPKKAGFKEIPLEAHSHHITAIFNGQTLRYAQAVVGIRQHYDLGESKAKEFLREMVGAGLVEYNTVLKLYSQVG